MSTPPVFKQTPDATRQRYSDLFLSQGAEGDLGHHAPYRYRIMHGARSFKAFETRKALDIWLSERGLSLPRPLAPPDQTDELKIEGGFVEQMLFDVEAFEAIEPLTETRMLNNGDYNLAKVTEEDGERVVSYMHRQFGPVPLDYWESRMVLGEQSHPYPPIRALDPFFCVNIRDIEDRQVEALVLAMQQRLNHYQAPDGDNEFLMGIVADHRRAVSDSETPEVTDGPFLSAQRIVRCDETMYRISVLPEPLPDMAIYPYARLADYLGVDRALILSSMDIPSEEDAGQGSESAGPGCSI